MITREELEAIHARCDGATSGPWKWDGATNDPDDDPGAPPHVPQGSFLGDTLIALDDTYENCRYDCDFIAHARTDIPRLLRELERLQQIVRQFSPCK